MWHLLKSIPRRAPFAFAVWYGGAKTIGADIMVQKCVEGRDEIDNKRATVFLCFGLFQVGFVQYLLYCRLFARLFPTAESYALKPIAEKLADRIGTLNVGKQVCLDQFVYHPVMYFPVFYTCKEIVNGNTNSLTEMVWQALQKYHTNMLDDLKALWKIYIPVSILQCSVVPMHLRVPFVATIGIFWCAILSYMRGEDAPSQMDEAVRRIATIDPKELTKRLEQARLRLATSGINRQEFISLMAQPGLSEVSGMTPEMSSSLFDVLDVDGTGILTADKLTTGSIVLSARGTPEEPLEFVQSNLDFCDRPVAEIKESTASKDVKTTNEFNRLSYLLPKVDLSWNTNQKAD